VKKRTQKRLISVVLSLLLITLTALYSRYQQQYPSSPVVQTIPSGFYKIAKFDDGDTIVVDMDGHNETVRFIGVDTPETRDPRKAVQCFGYAAAEFTEKLIGSSPVRLESDPINTNRDRYNRLLRYVYLPDGQLVNAELIKQGYGFAYLSFPFTKAEEFRQYETDAREANRGLWAICQPKPNQYGGYTSNDAN
jgi:micrococcal nuclease